MDATEKMLQDLFKQMGADELQSQRMASQLLKRANQLAKEESISEIEALQNLLKKILEGQK
ncbi:MAG: Uncharacterised protein [Puniceicoccaceae bacterium MED-G32]|jgi:hypothetical protein|nr:hypothetical protein [Puniceicoccaceae bacterium]RPG15911.1 MAG: hypothetical protein CBD67_000345 [Opitutales bacterium TMED207]CAI8298817.1 MAG: Uncharacterised protein [Puniceicoccaceae bacterium MED-G32]|tara:strand:+ start:13205 stop:13387 length:183 start_codon:yes stop_codon:yes gene_type:complete